MGSTLLLSSELAAPTGRIQDYLTPEEIAALHEMSTVRVWRDAALVWGVIAVCLGLAAHYQSVTMFVFCFLVIASRQLALTHFVHEASHFRLTANKGMNDWVGDIFFAAPVLISTHQYRLQHLPHHRHLGNSDLDTDKRAWYSIKGWNFLRRSLIILLGGEAALTIFSYSNLPQDEGSEKFASLSRQARRMFLVLITNGLILLYCWVLGAPVVYFTLWLLPMFTLTMYLLALRVIAEHQAVEYATLGRDDFQLKLERPLIRTVQPGLLGRFFLGSCNFFYHHEHHLAPAVPYTNLPRLHQLLVTRHYFRKYPQALGGSYFSTLYRLVFP